MDDWCAPIIIITLDTAWFKLFTASSVTAMELDTMPTNALNAASTLFANMPSSLYG